MAENAYCPYTDTPCGCSLLVDDKLIFGGCNIENGVLSASVDAAEVAVFKAISEGYTDFRAMCIWSEKRLPYPSGRVRQILAEFSPNMSIIIASDETYTIADLADLFPYPPETNDD